MFALEDETVLFLYCWTLNEMQIPATRDRRKRLKCAGPSGSRRAALSLSAPRTRT
jgi:hypothetical protein